MDKETCRGKADHSDHRQKSLEETIKESPKKETSSSSNQKLNTQGLEDFTRKAFDNEQVEQLASKLSQGIFTLVFDALFLQIERIQTTNGRCFESWL